MDKEHDEILNELIKYYDEGKDESVTSDEENIDDTIVISKNTPAPQEETFGDTVIVNVKQKHTEPDEPTDEAVTDETTAIPKVKPEEPIEEVFGNLGLDGKPIDTNDHAQDTQNMQRRHIDINPVEFHNEPEPEEIPKKKRGIWYALKPLWATIITCLCLYLLGLAYINGYVDTFIFNFKCNLELICESIGIEYHPFDDTTSANPYPAVLSDEGDTIYLSMAEASENYTEHNNVREDAPSEYGDISEYRKCLPFEEADNSDFSAYYNGVVCAKSNYICYLNGYGEKEWEYNTSVSDPILSTSGEYIAIAAKEGTQVNLYKGSEFIYSTDVPNKIKTCKVSYDGDIVLVTEQPAYKGAVIVINKKGEEVFSWVSGVNYITSASPLKGRNISVLLTDTSARMTSYVMQFDIYSPDPINAVEIKDTLLYDASFSANIAYASGDNCISAVNPDGGIVYDIRFDSAYITHSDSDKYGNRLVTFTENYIPAMNVYDTDGGLVYSGTIETSPDCIDIFESTVLYNNEREVICNNTDKNHCTAYTSPMSVRDLILLNEDSYVIVYEDTLEFIGV